MTLLLEIATARRVEVKERSVMLASLIHKILLRAYKLGVKVFSRSEFANFYPLRVADAFVRHKLKSNVAEVNGHKMFLDTKDSLQLSTLGVYEPLETELVKNEVKKGDVVLDIGANIGYYTLIFARLVGNEGRVIAFEPDPDNFALLKRNTEINGYKNVRLIQKAVSGTTGNTKLYLSEDNKGDHRIYDVGNGRKSIEIEVIRLDDYFKNYHDKIDFIKMDIQGAEMGAIRGMTALLQSNEKIELTTEFWPIGLKNFGDVPEEYIKLLLTNGFKIYHIDEQKKKIEPVDVAELLKAYTPEKGNYTDLLCIKGARSLNLKLTQ